MDDIVVVTSLSLSNKVASVVDGSVCPHIHGDVHTSFKLGEKGLSLAKGDASNRDEIALRVQDLQ
jgi:hypothetical protein